LLTLVLVLVLMFAHRLIHYLVLLPQSFTAGNSKFTSNLKSTRDLPLLVRQSVLVISVTLLMLFLLTYLLVVTSTPEHSFSNTLLWLHTPISNGLVGETAQSNTAFNEAAEYMRQAVVNALYYKDLTITPDPPHHLVL
jgi:hypothetical protein